MELFVGCDVGPEHIPVTVWKFVYGVIRWL